MSRTCPRTAPQSKSARRRGGVKLHNYLKTSNGKREIDLHSSVGAMLRKYIGERKSGLLFCSKAGRPLRQSNILRRTLHPILAELGQPKCGAHAFRRFRLTWLRQNTVPRDLEHSGWATQVKTSETCIPNWKATSSSLKKWPNEWVWVSHFRPKRPLLDRRDRGDSNSRASGYHARRSR